MRETSEAAPAARTQPVLCSDDLPGGLARASQQASSLLVRLGWRGLGLLQTLPMPSPGKATGSGAELREKQTDSQRSSAEPARSVPRLCSAGGGCLLLAGSHLPCCPTSWQSAPKTSRGEGSREQGPLLLQQREGES